MQHVNTSIAGTAGVLIGVVAGAGTTSLMSGTAAPVVEDRVVVVSPYDGPEQPDRLIQWLKQHPRGR